MTSNKDPKQSKINKNKNKLKKKKEPSSYSHKRIQKYKRVKKIKTRGHLSTCGELEPVNKFSSFPPFEQIVQGQLCTILRSLSKIQTLLPIASTLIILSHFTFSPFLLHFRYCLTPASWYHSQNKIVLPSLCLRH